MFVKNGVLRLLPGFRFHPTDQELLLHYLKPKVSAFPLPASIIPEVHLCNSDPWDLPGDLDQERYFFSTREIKYPNGNRSNRAAASGYWKATGLDKKILTTRATSNQVVGMKKTLVFYRGKPPHGSRTDWIMHEYRLLTPPPQGSLDNWVLCRIFLKKRGTKNDNPVEIPQSRLHTHKANRALTPVFYDFMANNNNRSNSNRKTTRDLNLAPASSSSGSSGITEASSDGPEETTSCNTFTTKRTLA